MSSKYFLADKLKHLTQLWEIQEEASEQIIKVADQIEKDFQFLADRLGILEKLLIDNMVVNVKLDGASSAEDDKDK